MEANAAPSDVNPSFQFGNFGSRLIDFGDEVPFFEMIESNRSRLVTFLPITASENATPPETAEYVIRKTQEASSNHCFTMVLVHQPKHEFAGFMVIKNLDWEKGECELGYFIAKEWEGQGVMTEYVRHTCKYCLDVLKMQKISIVTSPNNKGSVAVANRNGFQFESQLDELHKDEKGNEIVVCRYVLTST